MRRAAWIFLLAIFLPSLALAWLAVHSIQDQQVVLEHQQALLFQEKTDSLAQNLQQEVMALQEEFIHQTQRLLENEASAQDLAENFNGRLRAAWPLAEIGFVVDLNGHVYSPKPSEGARARNFRQENDLFLGNQENAEVYLSTVSQKESRRNDFAPSKTLKDADDVSKQESASGSFALDMKKSGNESPSPTKNVQQEMADKQDGQDTSLSQERNRLQLLEASSSVQAPAETKAKSPQTPASAPAPASSGDFSDKLDRRAQGLSRSKLQTRNVSPQQNINEPVILSNTLPEESTFRKVTGQDTRGILARFVENKLQIMAWCRPRPESPLIFGVLLNKAQLIQRFSSLPLELSSLRVSSLSKTDDFPYCLAILDDTGHPVVLSKPNFKTDWKHPFVSTEMGETLPHWEAALYLIDPQQIGRSARTLQLTIGLIVLLLILAIVSGGSLIAADIRRQTLLAQQKTDFVSNVSHELKTPLTSIRMFADLLSEGRVDNPERQKTFLKIISSESARLTRLINNVLDFARLERGTPSGEHRPCELVEIVSECVETCRPHLENNGLCLPLEIEAERLPMRGNRDAIAQIVLNLISNAEKYGGKEILVRIRQQETDGGKIGCVDVLDRGAGIPAPKVKSIFEPFTRLDDSLASGIPGSGLGLTLARRLARAHGGDVHYAPRAGGGSCFTLCLPLVTDEALS